MARPFVPGDPRINRNGRPPKSLEKKWYDIQWWYRLITDNVDKLSDKEKVELGLRGLSLIVSKLPSVPASPEESAQRIIDVRGELEKAEINVSAPGNDPVRVGTSETEIQARAETEGSV